MPIPLVIYTVTWITLLVAALVISFTSKPRPDLYSKHYLRFLFVPWKVVTWVIAIFVMTLVGPYTGDPTWDYVTGGVMSVLTVYTSPWCVGLGIRVIKGMTKRWDHLFVAVLISWFSFSWFYDLYLFFRDGFYPITWAVNIGASSMLYFIAGLLWNLEWDGELKGVMFAFNRDSWPHPPKESQNKAMIYLYLVPFVIVLGSAILVFFV